MNLYTADKATPHQQLEIEEVGESDISLKLLEMGIMPGKILTLLHVAPLGDPMAFQLGEAVIALRKEEAQLISVSSRKAVLS